MKTMNKALLGFALMNMQSEAAGYSAQ